jgi:phage repressor protein C with HTH and peptisase S24 domain
LPKQQGCGNNSPLRKAGFSGDGDVIVVSPATPIRRGDRVVVTTAAGEVLVGEVKRRSAKTLELGSLDAGGADRALAPDDVEWIARIMWTRH